MLKTDVKSQNCDSVQYKGSFMPAPSATEEPKKETMLHKETPETQMVKTITKATDLQTR